MLDTFMLWPLQSAVALLFGYLCGSIPFGVILTHLAGTQDIRTVGSGNIGATNVLRTGNKGLAAATLLGDMLKGTAAVLLVLMYGRGHMYLFAGLGAFLGHLFPVWLGFKGGKGVATYLGILIAMNWPAFLAAPIFCVLWLAIAAVTRYSSLAALIASAATPLAMWALGAYQDALMFALLTVILWYMHRENIARLRNGSEGKIGQKS
jgi:glycerol-3-phosphate acyltransferase PlsY